jgi:hypothetical protein
MDSAAVLEFMIALKLVEPMQAHARTVKKHAIDRLDREFVGLHAGTNTDGERDELNRLKGRKLIKVKRMTDAIAVRTFRTVDSDSWLDYYLVSSKLMDRGLVRTATVVDEGLNDGNHSAVVLDIDLDSALGKTELWRDIEEATKLAKDCNMNAIFKTIQLKKAKRVGAYQEAVVEKWAPNSKLSRRILSFYKEVEAKRASLGDTVDWERIKEVSDKLMDEAVGVLIQAQGKVYSTLPKAGSGSAHTKHVMTGEAKTRCDSLRAKGNMTKCWELGWRRNVQATKKKPTVMIATAKRKKVWQMGSNLISSAPDVLDNTDKWKQYMARVEQSADREKGTLHCSKRKEFKTARLLRTSKLEDCMERGI